MTIQEKNKVIAIFMDLPLTKTMLKFSPHDTYEQEISYNFHDDWRLLIPVVEKIETIMGGVNILRGTCSIYDEPFKRTGEGYHVSTAYSTKLEATYEAVFKFIIWYAKNKDHDNTNRRKLS